jgi:putative endonuclease
LSDTRRHLGQQGEAVARRYLERQGYTFRQANYRCPLGEIDLIFQDGDTLVFVEVKTRSGRALGTPEESVNARKRQKLQEVAETYLQEHKNLPLQWRIDVVAVEATLDGDFRVRHIKDAVEEG